MRWIQGVPEKLYLAGCQTSKSTLLDAMWLAISKGCLSNQDEALDMCLTYINEARKADGQAPIKRETITKWVKERKGRPA